MIVTWLIWTVAVLVADQVTKGIVLRRFTEGETSRLGLWIRLTRVTNRRAGWPQNRWAWLGLYAVGALGTAALLDHGPISQNGAVQASLGSAPLRTRSQDERSLLLAQRDAVEDIQDARGLGLAAHAGGEARLSVAWIDEDRDKINKSAIHIDFMIGSDDVEVTGLTRDGREVPVLRGGTWQP